MVTSLDSNLLLNYYNARFGLPATDDSGFASTPAKKVAPTAPWTQQTTTAQTSAAVKAVLAGRGFIDEGGAQLDLPSASEDYRKLFALYQGSPRSATWPPRSRRRTCPRSRSSGSRTPSPRG
jgi:hypothetical protein